MQASLPLSFAMHNRGLFADHFLNSPERLQSMVEWRQASGVAEAFKHIRQLYAERVAHFTSKTNEDQTERVQYF